MDELTLTGPSTVFELRDGTVTEYELDPRDYGFAVVDASAIAGGGPADNARIVRGVLAGQRSPYRDIIVLNAAAGLVVAGVVDDLAAGVAAAQESIDSGRAGEVLDRVIEVSNAAGSASDG
jgi:anthranilate phosphoribosyltransferase